MVNKKFVASQLRKLAAKMEENFSFAEAEAKGDFGAIYDHIVKKTFKKSWWRKTCETDSNWGVPILLPSDGSANNHARKIILENIAKDIKDKYHELWGEFYDLKYHTPNPSKSDKDRFEFLKKLFEKYGDECTKFQRNIMKNQETMNEFCNLPEVDYYLADYGGMVDGSWDFNSALKKYTLVYYGDGWEVFTSNSPEEILKIAEHSFTETGKGLEELADKVCHFYY